LTAQPTTTEIINNVPALSDRAFEKTQLKEDAADLKTRLIAGEYPPQLIKDGVELQDRIRAFKEVQR